jgi:hypothetical protein
MIGDFVEGLLSTDLKALAERVGLYCDCKGFRPGVRGNGRKVTWQDEKGNKHDLDYVLEKGASDHERGLPVAFIEFTWRRYTKHSVNKAGELANALVPLRRTYPTCRFAGAILAGEFTEPAKTQLTSQGIAVLHIPFDTIADAFAAVGIDLRYAETAGNEVKLLAIDKWGALGDNEIVQVADAVRGAAASQYSPFMGDLEAAVSSMVESVWILRLFGERVLFPSVHAAISALEGFQIDSRGPTPFVRFEVGIRYSNGERIEGRFCAKDRALEFLAKLA